MNNHADQIIPNRVLWWTSMALIVGLALYTSRAPNLWGLAMSAALAMVAVLLNHKRLVDAEVEGSTGKSILLALLMATVLMTTHFAFG